MIIPDKHLTPIERLVAEKKEIEAQCRLQEEKLNDDYIYIRENASGLLLSGLTSLLFSSGNSKNGGVKQTAGASGSGRIEENVSFSASDYLNIAKSLLPVAWEIAQPIIITWGINKAKSLLLGLFTKKKKTPV